MYPKKANELVFDCLLTQNYTFLKDTVGFLVIYIVLVVPIAGAG